MNRILKVNIREILIDAGDVSRMLSQACARKNRMKITGVCQVDEQLLFCLEPDDFGEALNYVLAPFPSSNEDEMTGEIENRFHAGFSTLGDFCIGTRKWGFFSTGK